MGCVLVIFHCCGKIKHHDQNNLSKKEFIWDLFEAARDHDHQGRKCESRQVGMVLEQWLRAHV